MSSYNTASLHNTYFIPPSASMFTLSVEYVHTVSVEYVHAVSVEYVYTVSVEYVHTVSVEYVYTECLPFPATVTGVGQTHQDN